MSQTIKLKRNKTNSTTTPSTLLEGEIAVNILDKSLFVGDGDNVVRLYIGSDKYFNSNGYANNAVLFGGNEVSHFGTAAQITALNKSISSINANFDNYLSKISGGEVEGDVLIKAALKMNTLYLPNSNNTPSDYQMSVGSLGSGADTPEGGSGIAQVTINVNGSPYKTDANGVVTLPNYPTSLPASDVYDWAKKSSLAASDVPDLSGSYLSTGGGLISGGGNTPLAIKTTSANAWVGIKFFSADNTIQGNIGVQSDTPYYVNAAFTHKYTLLHAGNYSSYALPLSGGTISGNICLNYNLSRYSMIIFKDNRIYSSGYADSIILVNDGNDSSVGSIGLYGGINGVEYYYFGHNSYDGDNLRIYSDKLSFGDYTLYHTGNFNPANYLPLSGGTIEGGANALKIKRNGPYLSCVEFSNTDGSLGSLGFVWGNNPSFFHTDGNYYPLIHSGNIGSQSVASAQELITSGGNKYAYHNGLNLIFGRSSITTNIYGSDIKLRAQGIISLYINPSGNVTVGGSDLATTATKLFVDGGIRFAPKTIWGQSFDGTGNVSGDFYMTGEVVSLAGDLTGSNTNAASPKLWLGAFHPEDNKYTGSYIRAVGDSGYGNHTISFYTKHSDDYTTAPVERMRIASNGDVLIGTTTDNGAKLQVNGGIRPSTTASYALGNASYTWTDVWCRNIINNTTDGFFIGSRSGIGATDGGALIYSYGNAPISFYTKGTERMWINSAGEVNITGLLNLRPAGTNIYGSFGINADRMYIQAVHDGVAYLPIALNPSGGNVGIRTTAPTSTLHVNGSFRAGSSVLDSLTVNGSATFASGYRHLTRIGNTSYNSGWLYGTNGQEAMAFINNAAVSSFMFVQGKTAIENWGAGTWQSVIPALQIKQNCVAINYLWGQNVTPDYTLRVEGSAYFSDNIYASGYRLPTSAPSNPASGGYYLYVGTLGTGATIS